MAELVEIRAGVVKERLATKPASERVSRTILRRFYLVETLARIARKQRAFDPARYLPRCRTMPPSAVSNPERPKSLSRCGASVPRRGVVSLRRHRRHQRPHGSLSQLERRVGARARTTFSQRLEDDLALARGRVAAASNSGTVGRRRRHYGLRAARYCTVSASPRCAPTARSIVIGAHTWHHAYPRTGASRRAARQVGAGQGAPPSYRPPAPRQEGSCSARLRSAARRWQPPIFHRRVR
jgi:hypothetical protein